MSRAVTRSVPVGPLHRPGVTERSAPRGRRARLVRGPRSGLWPVGASVLVPKQVGHEHVPGITGLSPGGRHPLLCPSMAASPSLLLRLERAHFGFPLTLLPGKRVSTTEMQKHQNTFRGVRPGGVPGPHRNYARAYNCVRERVLPFRWHTGRVWFGLGCRVWFRFVRARAPAVLVMEGVSPESPCLAHSVTFSVTSQALQLFSQLRFKFHIAVGDSCL